MADVFDDTYYASSISEKIIRSVQLGLKYYFWAVPRYFWQRRSLSLPLWDPTVLINPWREFRTRNYSNFPPPPNFKSALAHLAETGARFSLPPPRVEALAGAWWQARSAVGDVIECGSFRGTTALFLALLGKKNGLPQKVLMLDTFKGMPPPSRFDPFRFAGEFALFKNQADIIWQRAKTLGIDDRIEVYSGLFSDTFAKLNVRDLRFAFIHIDANIYQGTNEACRFAIPRISPGGIVVFDDYNGVCDLGARLAIDQFFCSRQVRPIPLAAGSAYLQLAKEFAEKKDVGR
jgi:hypothetical protein